MTFLPALAELYDFESGVPVRVHVFTNLDTNSLHDVAAEHPALTSLPLHSTPFVIADAAAKRIMGMGGFKTLTPTHTPLPVQSLHWVGLPPGLATGPGGQLPNVSLTFHTGSSGLASLPTFYHLTQADVFVGSRSSFSEVAALVSTVPLAFSQAGNKFGPTSRAKDWVYYHCGKWEVCCDEFTGDCGEEGRRRIRALLNRRGLLRDGA